MRNGVKRCQGASCSVKHEVQGALGDERDLELKGCAFFWNIIDPPSNTIYYSVLWGFKGMV